jgi:hypothetical protein
MVIQSPAVVTFAHNTVWVWAARVNGPIKSSTERAAVAALESLVISVKKVLPTALDSSGPPP